MNHSDFCVDKTPIELMYHWEQQRPNEVFLRQPIDGQWHEYRWLDVAHHVRRLAAAFGKHGIQKGDKVAILSKNCAEWFIADLAMQMAGIVSVPLYSDLSNKNLTYVLEHSESKAVFIGKLDAHIWARLESAIPANIMQIAFSNHGKAADFNRSHFSHHLMDWVEQNEAITTNPKPNLDDDFTIIYTSGTTGTPKGAVHTYHAPSFSAPHAIRNYNLNTNDRFFSYLPLAHVAERYLIFTLSIYCGGSVGFGESIETFQQNIGKISPTFLFAVPRLWQKFQEGVLKVLPQNKLDTLLKIPLVSSFIKSKVRKNLGLKDNRLALSGAASMSSSLLNWYDALGIQIMEAYAMTENYSYGCISPIGKTKIGTVGKPMPGSGFKLSDANEVLFKAPTVMRCYYKEPELTKEAFDADGYFKTGDKGEVDADGYVTITGRFKEIFKTEKGEYVVPTPIEDKALANTDFEQVCLSGAGLAQPVLVVQLSDSGKAKSRNVLAGELEIFIEKLNKELQNHEKINGIVVSNFDWTPATDMVTPTLKVKRETLQKHYQDLMQQLNHRRGNSLVFES